MKSAGLLLCFIASISLAQQSDIARSIDRVGNEIAIGNMEAQAARNRAESQAQWTSFYDSMNRATANLVQARWIQLQNQRAAEYARSQSAAIGSAPPPTPIIVEVKSEKEKEPGAKSEPQAGRYQLMAQGGTILKLDTATGQTMQYSVTSGVGVWVDVTDSETSKTNLVNARRAALEQWIEVQRAKDASFDKNVPAIIGLATPAIDKRQAELGRLLNGEELVEVVEQSYKQVRTSGSAQTSQFSK